MAQQGRACCEFNPGDPQKDRKEDRVHRIVLRSPHLCHGMCTQQPFSKTLKQQNERQTCISSQVLEVAKGEKQGTDQNQCYTGTLAWAHTPAALWAEAGGERPKIPDER